jgi:hypothetical protein
MGASKPTRKRWQVLISPIRENSTHMRSRVAASGITRRRPRGSVHRSKIPKINPAVLRDWREREISFEDCARPLKRIILTICKRQNIRTQAAASPGSEKIDISYQECNEIVARSIPSMALDLVTAYPRGKDIQACFQFIVNPGYKFKVTGRLSQLRAS